MQNSDTIKRASMYALISRLLLIEVDIELVDTIKNNKE